jgi:hypothetical protein
MPKLSERLARLQERLDAVTTPIEVWIDPGDGRAKHVVTILGPGHVMVPSETQDEASDVSADASPSPHAAAAPARPVRRPSRRPRRRA